MGISWLKSRCSEIIGWYDLLRCYHCLKIVWLPFQKAYKLPETANIPKNKIVHYDCYYNMIKEA